RISREEVVELYDRVASFDVDLSFFETVTLMTFEHFSRKRVDFAVTETGMGGASDATNILQPELSIITNVSQEHTDWLGETEEEIARRLAGVVKEEVPVVSGAGGRAGEVIEEAAEVRGAEFHSVSDSPEVLDTGSFELHLEIEGEEVDTGLVGSYQPDNVATALEALGTMDREVSPRSVRRALENVSLEGRMEPVSREPLVLLDGAHNPAAVERLPETLERLDGERTIVVTSIMEDKDYERMLETIESFADLVILSEAEKERAAPAEKLEASLGPVETVVRREVHDAVGAALSYASEEDTVLFTGSLYFVGDVKRVLEENRFSS
ncbi:MAG: cyanophycin synthetase, partial [Candidatus Nanohaloarchaea archaeon]|nr:cyanophycin synthetase [Candidatus Nanohaloarchaea archaeon]